MCGIFALFNYKECSSEKELRVFARFISSLIGHRGPDWSGVKTFGNECVLAHERLSIVGTNSGAQPLISSHSSCCLTVNGEIYNYLKIQSELKSSHSFSTQSDCEVILHLYEEYEKTNDFSALCQRIDGIFAFVLYDGKDFFAARDHVGICPLYQGWGKDGSVWFASEMKCLVSGGCERIESFPPGHYSSSRKEAGSGVPLPYYQPKWFDINFVPSDPVDYSMLRNVFIQTVKSQMMSEVPYGALLSGGLDSSILVSVLDELVKSTPGHENAQIMTFAIGLPGSPDLEAAKKVADWIKSKHYEFYFTIQEGIDMIPSMIWHLESYDVTTIRASIPMFFLSRHVKALGVKMVFSGEGSDEMFGGYLYFHQAPSPIALHQETVCRVKNLHLSDCLRANKSTMAWGVEARVPFLDRTFLDLVMQINPIEKMTSSSRIEKYILRKAFDCSSSLGKAYLPPKVLWRQKEQFSDGVGYSWIDSLKAHTESMISDERMMNACKVFPIDTPTTKEAYFYREIFESKFPTNTAALTVKRWIPRIDWGCSADPSGRAQITHFKSIE